MSGITITCFAASYLVALALEVTRLFFRSGVRGALMIGFGSAGLVAQTLFLAARLSGPDGTGWFDWFLLAAWVMAATYLYLTFYHPKNPIGLFVLPLVLGLIAVAGLLPADRSFANDASAWGTVHGLALMLGTAVVMIGFVGGLMYLIQSERLKRKLPPLQRFRLPSLEWTEKVTGRCIVISTILLSVGVLSGLALNAINSQATHSPVATLPWTDPVVWTSGLLLVWLVTAMVFNMIYRPARQGRKVAYLTLASMIFLLLVLAVILLAPSQHPTANNTCLPLTVATAHAQGIQTDGGGGDA